MVSLFVSSKGVFQMSEVMQIDSGAKKLSKSEAIRQSFTILGSDADSRDVQQHAEKTIGAEIDIRSVYQIKSNLKTGRDTTTKSSKPVKAPRQIAPKAPRKVSKPVENSSYEETVAFGNFENLFKLLALVKQFGGSKKVMTLLEQIETAA
jgi:hypothetical protein